MSNRNSIIESLGKMQCINCNYSLRGLAGNIVICPECGLGHDLVKILAEQRNLRWNEVPLYREMFKLGVWAYASIIVLSLAQLFYHYSYSDNLIIPYIVWSVALAIWVWFLLCAGNKYGSKAGIWFALLIHLIIAARLGSLVFMIAGVALFGMSLYERTPASFIVSLLMFGLVPVLIIEGKAVAKFIGKRCLKKHLSELGTS